MRHFTARIVEFFQIFKQTMWTIFEKKTEDLENFHFS